MPVTNNSAPSYIHTGLPPAAGGAGSGLPKHEGFL